MMTKKQIIQALLIVCIIIQIESVRPKQKGFVAGNAGDFKTNQYEQIMAYFDVDRDGEVDIITKSAPLTMSSQSLNFYVWNKDLREYRFWSFLPIDYLELETVFFHTFQVFTMFHVVLYYKNAFSGSSMKIIPFTCQQFACSFSQRRQIAEIQSGIDPIDPTLITINGKTTILHSKDGIASLVLFSKDDDSYKYEIKTLSSMISGSSSINSYAYSFNGDFDGDCIADLILQKSILNEDGSSSSILQFMRGNTQNSYIFIKEVLFEEIQHFALQDINFDGKIDLIILLKNSKIQIHYHRYGSDAVLCNGLDYNNIPYDFTISSSSASMIQRVQLGGYGIADDSLLLFGDYNADSFDDLSLTVRDLSTNSMKALLLQNIGCVGAECGTYNEQLIQQSSTLNLRTFKPVTINGIGTVSTRLSFINIGTYGNLDLFYHIQITDPVSGKKYSSIQTVFNNNDYDAFFLSIYLLSKQNQSNQFQSSQFIGATASFYVTLLSGTMAPKSANQLSQPGRSLQIPFIYQGLGRTNNYIENLIASVPRNPYQKYEWTPIIPNSDILVIPPSKDADAGQGWILMIIIQPTEKIGLVLLLVIASLGVIGVFILRLTRLQKQEDKETQQSFYTLLR